jgi:hypothetical protein
MRPSFMTITSSQRFCTTPMSCETITRVSLCPARIAQQLQDLRAHRDVERRQRFVADEDARPVHDRAGQRDALALPAGELVRVAVGHRGLEPDRLEHLLRGRAGRRDAERPERLADDPADAHAGSSDAYGSWNTMPVSRRSQCSDRADARVDRRPPS